MSKRAAFWIFIIGTASSLAIFLFLTWDTHHQVDVLTHADRLSEQVVAGKHVWEKKNCNNCHTILGFGVYYAPDLTNVYQRIGADGIIASVQRPEEVYAGSFRKMPNLGVTDQEAQDLVAFLEWTGNIENNDWPPQDRNRALSSEERRLAGTGLSLGAIAFKQECMGCHSIGGVGGGTGPALDDIGDRYDAVTIARYIGDPTSVDPGSRMPAQSSVSDDDRTEIGIFLAKQGGDR
jgi:nitric oxide reductase subunit C